MSEASLPIDPKECELRLEKVSPMLAALHVRVPAALVKRFKKKMRRVGREADANDLRNGLLHFCVTQGFNESGMRAVSLPGWMPGTAIPRASPDHDFEAVIALDIASKLAAPDVSQMSFELPEAEVTEAMIEQEVRSQCRQFGASKPVAVLSRGNDATLDVEYRLHAHEGHVLAYKAVPVTIPAEGDALMVAGERLAEGAAKLVGARPGDKRVTRGVYPGGGPNRFLRGTPTEVTLSVREAKDVEPVPVERVLSEYGMPNEARLRTQIRFALEDKRERDERVIMRHQLSEHLVRAFPIDLPVLRGASGRAAAETTLREVIAARGLSGEAAESEFQRLLPEAHAKADHSVKLEYIVRSLAYDLGVAMDEDIIAGRLAATAADAGVRPETLRAELVKTGQYKEYVERLFAELALDKLLLNAKPRRIPTAEWEARHSGAHAAS